MRKSPFGSAKDYFAATSQLIDEGKMPEHQWRMLQLHRRAPKSQLTFLHLAKQMGYKTFGGVNMHYGRLARQVASRMGVRTRPSEGFWLFVLVDWVRNTKPGRNTRFVLRPEVVDAIDRLEARWTARRRAD